MNAQWNAPISDRFSSLCARVSPAAAILESEMTLRTRLDDRKGQNYTRLFLEGRPGNNEYRNIMYSPHMSRVRILVKAWFFLNLEKEIDRDKDKVGDSYASEAQQEKERHRASARDKKKQREHFLLEEQHENFVPAVWKWEMLAATKVKMCGSEKKSEQELVRRFLHKTCNWEVSGSRFKTSAKKWTKSVVHLQSWSFAN